MVVGPIVLWLNCLLKCYVNAFTLKVSSNMLSFWRTTYILGFYPFDLQVQRRTSITKKVDFTGCPSQEFYCGGLPTLS